SKEIKQKPKSCWTLHRWDGEFPKILLHQLRDMLHLLDILASRSENNLTGSWQHSDPKL
ncbi:hypothetical protein AMECASPLE_024453, partial [Ameca splendens]